MKALVLTLVAVLTAAGGEAAFSVGLATEAQERAAAQALIEFLAGPRAAAVYKAKGLGG